MPFFKSLSSARTENADKDSTTRPDGSRVLVRKYQSANGLASESVKMAEAGWRIESQIAPKPNRIVVTWVKDAPSA